ncbi:MAG TPA: hypothetical protein VLZ84_10475, partial [Asticcacaulis sp.]|nr:hypothetical protein [Asticcacaulis sp.]
QNLSPELFETMPMMQGWISVTYAAMNGMCQADTPAWRARLDEVREAFDDAGKLFMPSVREKQGGIVKLHARIAELETESVAPQTNEALLSEHIAVVEALNAEKAGLIAERDEISQRLLEASDNYKDLVRSQRDIRAITEAEVNDLRALLAAKEDEAGKANAEATLSKTLMASAAQASEATLQKLRTELTRLQSDQASLVRQLAEANERTQSANAKLDAQKSRHLDVERRLNSYRQAGRLRLVRWAIRPASRP